MNKVISGNISNMLGIGEQENESKDVDYLLFIVQENYRI